jgi:hypothetical protein
MTRQKTITSLSIAAIALLAVAVPTFAQAQSAEDQPSAATQASEEKTVSGAELIAATKMRGTTFEFERARFNDSTRTVKQPKLSASDFKAHNSFTSATSSHFVSPQLSASYFVPTDPTAKKQFNSEEYEGSKGRKLVTFVPSRGQKLPL